MAVSSSQNRTLFYRRHDLPGLELVLGEGMRTQWASYTGDNVALATICARPGESVSWRSRFEPHRATTEDVLLVDSEDFYTLLHAAPLCSFRELQVSRDRMQGSFQELGWTGTELRFSRAQHTGGARLLLLETMARFVMLAEPDEVLASLRGLLSLLREQSALGPPHHSAKAGPTWLRETCSFLRDRFRESLTLRQVVERSGKRRSTFGREFPEAVGVPPLVYQRHVRLAHARAMLRSSRGSVARIARQCGFDDSKYFTRLFTRHFGVPPARYRNDAVDRPWVIAPSCGPSFFLGETP